MAVDDKYNLAFDLGCTRITHGSQKLDKS